MSKEKTESYYKILGTTAKIGNARIKEKYIEAVKKHPPETDPEGFERVRRAYETLKDPVKRKQYDLVRKYGTSVEELIEKANIAMEVENYQEANQLLTEASMIDPENGSVLINLMLLSIIHEDFEEMERLFNQAIDIMSGPEEITTIYTIKARLLYENDYTDLAIETLEEGRKLYPDQIDVFAIPLVTLYMEAGRSTDAMEIILTAIPNPENETYDDIHTFITWSNLALVMEKSSIAKVEMRFRKFLKNLTEEEKKSAYELLFQGFDGLYDDANFRAAQFYVNLLKVVADDSQVAEIKQLGNDTKQLARIQKEIDRLQSDEDAFPLLFLQAFEWFYEDLLPMAELSMGLNSIPEFLIDELKEEKEEYAAGIMRLKKKYPILYKEYKEQWDSLFNELTQGFNREMRRELRRMK